MFSEKSNLSPARLASAAPTRYRRGVPLPRHGRERASDAFPTAQGHYLPKRARTSVHRRTPRAMIMTDTDTDTHPIPTDGDKPNSTCVKPTLTAVSLGSAVQLQLRLDSDDNDGDDEQDYNHHDEDDLERSHSHSPVPHVPTPPAQHQQHQPAPTSTTTPTTSPFAAHVHFHSRVRITSGLHRSRGNRTLGDSSDSDSPSSSISAPLRYQSQSTVSRLPLGERISRLAAQALQKRRMATASRSLRARDNEYTPFLRAAPYGTARHGYSGVVDDADSEDEHTSQLNDLHGEDGITLGRWPWRALNRQVSSTGGFFVQTLSSFASVVEVAN